VQIEGIGLLAKQCNQLRLAFFELRDDVLAKQLTRPAGAQALSLPFPIEAQLDTAERQVL
jgi:hypothetical protein